jgi:hypothetical protein
MPTWTTVQKVKSLTRKTVTDDDIDAAEATLATTHGLIPGVERKLSDRDAYFLSLATAYQAAWMTANPDLHERLDVNTASQDGQSATFGPDALVLAPLARRALRRLSWRGTRTIGGVPPATIVNVNDDDWEDANLPWRPVE